MAPASPGEHALAVGPGTGATPGIDWFDALVADLDSPMLERRDRAGLELATDARVTLEMIEQRLAESTRPDRALSVEQRESLMRVGRRAFENAPRAAMGVQFGRFDGGGGVEVTATVPGFEALRVIRPGDVLRSIDDARITIQADARAAIVSHDPGDTVRVDLVRMGEPLTVTVRLGSFVDLQNARELEPWTLDAAWRLRCARKLGVPPLRELDAGMSVERWGHLDELVRTRAEQAPQERPAGKPLPATTRTVTDEGPPPPPLSGGGDARTLTRESDPDFALREGAKGGDVRTDRIRGQIAVYRNQIQIAERRLRDRTIPANTRRSIEAQITAYKKQIDLLRLQLRTVQEQVEP